MTAEKMGMDKPPNGVARTITTSPDRYTTTYVIEGGSE